MSNKLPEICFVTMPSTGETVVVKRYEMGYYPQEPHVALRDADEMNMLIDVSKAQQEAMLHGSMFGWDCPAADPNTYDENGHPKR